MLAIVAGAPPTVTVVPGWKFPPSTKKLLPPEGTPGGPRTFEIVGAGFTPFSDALCRSGRLTTRAASQKVPGGITSPNDVGVTFMTVAGVPPSDAVSPG